MPNKIAIKVTKGSLTGKEFSYDAKESLILGRQNDCSIVFPENTVSRYHCLLDINPPSVVVRDFGSLNGTYLNGTVIGQREALISVDEARKNHYNEFPMNDGDRLGLGGDCEVTVFVRLQQYCSECLDEISDDESQCFEVNPGVFLCQSCHERKDKEKEEDMLRAEARLAAERAIAQRKEAEKRAAELAAKEKAAADQRAKDKAAAERKEAEKRAAELAAKEKAAAEQRAREEAAKKAEEARRQAEIAQRKQKKCQICGTVLSGSKDDVNICTQCAGNPMLVLELLLRQAMEGTGDAAEIKGYRKIKSLGRGGMGEVWQVEEEKTGKQMALKLMLPKVAANEYSREMFLREAYVAQQLNHKNVVQQYKSGNSGDTFFILMELCQGGSVEGLINKNGGKLSIDKATEIILQVLDGLSYTHSAVVDAKLKNGSIVTARGIVHRDFKPANIFLSDTSSHPVAKVADFGLAKAFETAGLTGHTRTGGLAGTPVFMPRQQIINYRYALPDVDVWAAAASYYFMLTGEYPKDFSGKDVFMAALSNPAIPIRKRSSLIPKKLAEVIDQALVEKPSIGVQSAAKLKKMIEDAL